MAENMNAPPPPPGFSLVAPDGGPPSPPPGFDKKVEPRAELGRLIGIYKRGGRLTERQINLVDEFSKRKGLGLTYGMEAGDESMSFGEFLEPLATMASSIVAEPVAGLAGAAGAIIPGEDGQAMDWLESVRDTLTYKPDSEMAQQVLSETGEAMTEVPGVQEIGDIPKKIGDFTYEMTGSPTIASVAATTPAALAAILGIKGIISRNPGIKVLTPDRRPTPEFRKELRKDGIEWESLDDNVKEIVPEIIEPKLLPGGKSLPDAAAEAGGSPVSVERRMLPGGNPAQAVAKEVLAEEMKAGGTHDSFARLKLDPYGNITPDKAGLGAIKQGFREGVVQSIKMSDATTKGLMKEMLIKRRQIFKNERLAADITMRPTNVVGDQVVKKIRVVRDTADDARQALDEIATNNLPGKTVDTEGIFRTLDDALQELDVNYNNSNPYKGSMISKDRTSQKIIDDAIDLITEQEIDALRAHKLKRQLDTMLDYRKKSGAGLTDAGKKVAKKIRRSLNEAIRDVDPDYADVNDTLSKSLDTIESIEDAVSGKVDIFGDNADAALGQEMRKLLSNYNNRVNLEDALTKLEQTAIDFGADPGGDLRQLVTFANTLDEQFGATARGSFQGVQEQAFKRAMKDSVNPADIAKKTIGQKIGSGIEKFRGINDDGAFDALEKLLE